LIYKPNSEYVVVQKAAGNELSQPLTYLHEQKSEGLSSHCSGRLRLRKRVIFAAKEE